MKLTYRSIGKVVNQPRVRQELARRLDDLFIERDDPTLEQLRQLHKKWLHDESKQLIYQYADQVGHLRVSTPRPGYPGAIEEEWGSPSWRWRIASLKQGEVPSISTLSYLVRQGLFAGKQRCIGGYSRLTPMDLLTSRKRAWVLVTYMPTPHRMLSHCPTCGHEEWGDLRSFYLFLAVVTGLDSEIHQVDWLVYESNGSR